MPIFVVCAFAWFWVDIDGAGIRRLAIVSAIWVLALLACTRWKSRASLVGVWVTAMALSFAPVVFSNRNEDRQRIRAMALLSLPEYWTSELAGWKVVSTEPGDPSAGAPPEFGGRHGYTMNLLHIDGWSRRVRIVRRPEWFAPPARCLSAPIFSDLDVGRQQGACVQAELGWVVAPNPGRPQDPTGLVAVDLGGTLLLLEARSGARSRPVVEPTDEAFNKAFVEHLRRTTAADLAD